MENSFKIYVDQLKNGHIEQIDEEFSPQFIDVLEEDLKFLDPIKVSGEAYLAEEELVLHLNIETKAFVPCTICNKPVACQISIQGFYHMVPSTEIKTRVYDFSQILRETILLEAPSLAECEGECPKRKEIGKYLKQEGAAGNNPPPEDGQRPFAHLE